MERLRHGIGLSIGAVTLVAVALAGATVRPAAATDVPPKRVIKDQDPNFNTLWVDVVNDEILVGNDAQETLQVYSRSANGLTAPLREVKGHATFITFPGQVVVDSVNNEIWSVGNDIADLVTVYPRTADGNVSPIRRINMKIPTIKFNRTWGLALDTVNNEATLTHQKRNAVTIWDRTANTDTNPGTTPKRIIRGAATGLADPHGVFVDTGRDEIYVVNLGHTVGATFAPSITVYPRVFDPAVPNQAPLRTIQGEETGLDNAKPVFVDAERREIVVANGSPSNTLLFFDQDASGNVAPRRIIKGGETGLDNPTGVFVDTDQDLIWVANWGNHTITAYPRGASGNQHPVRVISPTTSRVSTGIGNPGALYVDPMRDEVGAVN